MKKYLILFAILAVVMSAGCISLGTQTTDILMGNETIGSLVVVPEADGSYSVSINLFGMNFSKDRLTQTEAESITDKVAAGDFSAIDFLPSELPENMGTPSDLNEFINSITNMQLTNSGSDSVSDKLDISAAAENANQAFSNFENIVSGILGQ